MPSYYGPLPDWETGPLASNDVLDADKNGSVTAEIADTTTAAPSAVPAPDDLSNSVGGGKVLAPHLKQKILLDPKVEEARARVCQMVHRLGLVKAGARPQLSANVSGSRQIVGRIKRDPGAGNFSGVPPRSKRKSMRVAHISANSSTLKKTTSMTGR